MAARSGWTLRPSQYGSETTRPGNVEFVGRAVCDRETIASTGGRPFLICLSRNYRLDGQMSVFDLPVLSGVLSYRAWVKFGGG